MVNIKALVLIILLAVALRLVYLTKVPPSLNWDEVSHAYNALSLLKTGKDQWGQILPIINFRAYGDYPTALNLYTTVPFVLFWGTTDFAVRLPHVLIGVFTVVVLYIAGYWWFKSSKAGLWVAFVAATSPWLVWTSRQVLQSNWVVLLASLGLAFYGKKKTVPALLIWSLGLLAYHNMRIFIPLLMILVMATKRIFRLPLIILVVSLVILLFPGSQARNEWVGIINSGAIANIESLRVNSQLPILIAKLIYNRPIYFLSIFSRNYLDYLNPVFLFLKGGTQYQFSIPGWGLIPWLVLPFLYWGAVKLQRYQLFLVAWVLLAIIPAAITFDRWAVVRSTLMIPALMLITGWGLTRFQNVKLKLVTVLGLILYIGFYMKAVLTDYPQKYSQSWQYGYKQVVQVIKQQYANVDEIIITKKYGEPHEFILWFWPWNPVEYSPEWDYHANWYWINAFDKFKFVNDWEMQNTVKNLPSGKKYLIVSSPENLVAGQKINAIDFLDGKTTFIVNTL